ncbi:MAG: thioredoxin-disulfide reductase [Gemmatimonadales bacterium]|jgi:thioredoxin reductase (NADPH)|nr:MAG: thioredoxin-disulfide reductase [Gemmatimonadales bacterium]
MTEVMREKLVIIGSGPAGWTAAIYAARANLEPLVFEGAGSRTMIPGGQLMFTTDVENYPGFPEGITGQEMMMAFRKQAERFGTRIITEDIVKVDLSSYPRVLTSSGGKTVEADTVIIATGANAKWLDVPGEEELARTGGGVSACAVCDGALPFFREKRLAVVGGGDSAMEEALYLTNFASEVLLIHRRDAFRASQIMAERALEHPKITVVWNTVVESVSSREQDGLKEITGLRVKNTVTGEEETLEVGGLFVAIGHKPNTDFLEGQIDLKDTGYIRLPDGGRMATNVQGVFAAGDCVDDYYRQAVTAAGTGCMAALEAERWLAHGGIEAEAGAAVS